MIEADPFQPGQEGSDAVDPAGVAQQWGEALKDPKVSSALLGFGLQMMQPPSFGQTGMGQLAQGIGAAGETLTAQDEEARKEREQARKERDTSSQIDYRADTSDVKAGSLVNQQLRTEQTGRDLESRAQLRSAQAQVALANVGKVQAQVEALQAKTQLFPQDQQAKIDLARAKQTLIEQQTALAAARTETVAPTAAARVKKDEASANLSTTRAGAVDSNADVARRRVDAQEKRTAAQGGWQETRAENQRRRDYGNYVKEEEKARFMDRKRPPAKSYQDWLKTFNPPDATAPASPTAPAAPASTQPDSQLSAFDPSKAATTAPGRYMTPKGPLTWDGTKFTQ